MERLDEAGCLRLIAAGGVGHEGLRTGITDAEYKEAFVRIASSRITGGRITHIGE